MSRAADAVRAHPVAGALAALVVVGVAAVALYLFQPWQLFLDTRVDEAFPIAGTPPEADPATSGDDANLTGGSADDEDEPVTPDSDGEPVALLAGSFGDRSHPTSGTATVYELPDGTLTLRIDDLETDNGPDLYVYLSTAAPDAPAGEFDTEAVDLGRLKGNIGDQNYVIPPGTDLSRFTTVAIWCDRFSVVFGTAQLLEA